MKKFDCIKIEPRLYRIREWCEVGRIFNAENVDTGISLGQYIHKQGLTTAWRALTVETHNDERITVHGLHNLCHLRPEPGNTGRIRGSVSAGKGYGMGATDVMTFELPDGRRVEAEVIVVL